MRNINKVIKRQTSNTQHGRELCIKVHAGFLEIWPKGLPSQRYTRSWDRIFFDCQKTRAEEIVRERREKKKRRGGKHSDNT